MCDCVAVYVTVCMTVCVIVYMYAHMCICLCACMFRTSEQFVSDTWKGLHFILVPKGCTLENVQSGLFRSNNAFGGFA